MNGDRSYWLNQIRQLSGKEVETTSDVRKLDIPEELKGKDLRQLEKLEQVAEYLEKNPPSIE